MNHRPRKIIHIDADCFYVSCERVRFPCLREQPVGVLGNQGVFVIAKSYELKRLGVPTGMAVREAAALCPEAIFVKRDFRWYEEVSRRMLGCVETVSPQVEFYSIDECFFDASLLPRMLNKGTGSARCLSPMFDILFQSLAFISIRQLLPWSHLSA